MFLTTEPKSIEDFLAASNFRVPDGMKLEYFILPYNAKTNTITPIAQTFDFEPNNQQVAGVTDNIVYKKKDLKSKHSYNNSSFELPKTPGAFPITQIDSNNSKLEAMNDLIIAGADVDSPANVRVIESTRDSKTYILKEDRIFPKNTLFRFSRG